MAKLHIPTIAILAIAPIGASAACVDFTRDLKYQDKSNDIIVLQQILNSNEATRVTEAGPGSAGSEIDYFGKLTYRAVKRFQNYYKSEVLTPVGLTSGSGYVGELTRKKLAALSCDVAVTEPKAAETTTQAEEPVVISGILGATPYRTATKYAPGATPASVANAPASAQTTTGGTQTSIDLDKIIRAAPGAGATEPTSPSTNVGTIINQGISGLSTTTAVSDPRGVCVAMKDQIDRSGTQGAFGVAIGGSSPYYTRNDALVVAVGNNVYTPGGVNVIAGSGSFTVPTPARSYPFAEPNRSVFYFNLTNSVMKNELYTNRLDEAIAYVLKNNSGTSNTAGLCRLNPERAGASSATLDAPSTPGMESITARGYIAKDGTQAYLYLDNGSTIPLSGLTQTFTLNDIVEVTGNVVELNAERTYPGLVSGGSHTSRNVGRSFATYVTGNAGNAMTAIEQGSGYRYRVYANTLVQSGTYATFDASIRMLEVTGAKVVGDRYDY